MKRTIEEFKSRSPLGKLAAIADITSIIGVSLVTFLAGPFLSSLMGREFHMADFTFTILFYSCCLIVLATIATSSVFFISRFVKLQKIPQALGVFLLSLLLLWISFLVYPPVSNQVGSIFRISYLIPLKPNEVIDSLQAKTISQGYSASTVAILGKVSLKSPARPSDYSLVLYLKYSDSQFYEIWKLKEIDKPRSRFSRDTLYSFKSRFQIMQDGKFSIPSSPIFSPVPFVPRHLTDRWLVIIRKADDSFPFPLPDKVEQIPNERLEEIGAYLYQHNPQMATNGEKQ